MATNTFPFVLISYSPAAKIQGSKRRKGYPRFEMRKNKIGTLDTIFAMQQKFILITQWLIPIPEEAYTGGIEYV